MTQLPLAVDMDGTLLRTDLFAEQLAGRILRGRDPVRLLRAAVRGRASLKQEVQGTAAFDPATLPYRTEFLDWLRAQHAGRRVLVLATAADRSVAHRVAAHLGIFQEVLASDGTTNLKRHRKAAALVARFGERGFAYAGDAGADLAVWRKAGAAVLVNASGRVSRQAAALAPVEARFDEPAAGRLRAAIKALRPRQWVKNLLVFLPILLSRAYDDIPGWIGSGAAFAAFCLMASSVYLSNDLLDIASDRAHPTKRNRPLAAGRLGTLSALALSAALMAAGLGLAWWAGALVASTAYAVLTFAYSTRLKELPLVDIFVLAALFTVRVVAGGEASGHHVSTWLMAFSGFLFLSLAIMKRVAELRARAADGGSPNRRRAYLPDDLPYLETLGVASSVTSALVLSLFVQAETGSSRVNPLVLMCTVPLVLFWQARLWLATWRGYMLEDPIVYATRDWVTRLVAVAIGGLFVASGLLPS